MEAALEERPLIEGSATEVDSGSNPPAETGNAAVPAEQAGAAPANQAQALPAVKDVMSQPAVRRAMPAIVGLLSLLVVLIFWSVMTSPPYRSVSDGMEQADVQLAFEALKSANYDVRINKSTGRLEVPENVFQAARIFLASQGIPRAAAEGGMG